jgi:hypothetical protein
MSLFEWKEFTNPLTDLLKANRDLPLHEFLMHGDLGPAVKNEADSIMTYLRHVPTTSTNRETNFAELARYALTNEWASDIPAALLSRYRLAQPSRNAATVLSAPSRKLMRLLNEAEGVPVRQRVFDFIYPTASGFNKDPVLAGHFQRIVASICRHIHPRVFFAAAAFSRLRCLPESDPSTRPSQRPQ